MRTPRLALCLCSCAVSQAYAPGVPRAATVAPTRPRAAALAPPRAAAVQMGLMDWLTTFLYDRQVGASLRRYALAPFALRARG